MKTKPYFRAFALALALLLTLSVLPPRARAAEGGNPYASASVKDITVKPASTDGHVRFGVAADVGEMVIGQSGDAAEGTALSIADAMNKACEAAFGGNESVKDLKFEYISGLSIPAAQGTLYDGYNTEGDTGMGVAAVTKYYYGDAVSNFRISNIRFVPKTTFTGQASIDYYGYYSYKETEITEAGVEREITRTGSYAGKVYITVSKQEPGIGYSTDGEPAQFFSGDFTNFCTAVTGRAFKYVSFRLPSAAVGTLYYNYISPPIYDYAVEASQRFYRTGIPSVDRVFFVPAKDYAGDVLIEFTGVDSADMPFTGQLVIHVTNSGPDHQQPNAEGPFVYRVLAGRHVNLDPKNFEEQVTLQIGSGTVFRCFTLASLPDWTAGTLYNDGSTGSAHTVRVGVNYYYPSDIRFAANVGYSGVVSVPIVVTATNGKTFDAMLRFVVTNEGDQPLRYKVEPERRVNFIAADFSDTCYDATGYELDYIVFDTLPSSQTGSLYYQNSIPVTTRSYDRYYRRSIGDLSFLANAGFVGEVSFSFSGYATNYYNNNGRWFHGTVTIVSTTVVEETPSIGGAVTSLTYSTWGPAVSLNYLELYNAAVKSLPGTPTTFSLSRPENGMGQLYLDFSSLSNYTEFDAGRSHPITDAARVSYVPKAGFSGTAQISYTVNDASGNSFTSSINFLVTPPLSSRYFSDMYDTAWAVQAVDFFRQYGATTGTSFNNFGPNDAMRRGDFLLLLQRLFSFPAAGVSSYDDVSPNAYYAGAIAGAKALGVVTDADARAVGRALNFHPEGAITRQDAALYLYRALRRAGKIQPGSAAELSRFPDASSVSAAAREAMGALVRDGVFQGYVNNLLPQRTLSRAETMAILYRALT